MKYLLFSGNSYKGADGDAFLQVKNGDIVKVSQEKAEQLLRDFPKEWKASSAEEFQKLYDERKAAADKASSEANASEAVKLEDQNKVKELTAKQKKDLFLAQQRQTHGAANLPEGKKDEPGKDAPAAAPEGKKE